MEGEKDKTTKACNNCGKCSCPALKVKVNEASIEIAKDLEGGQEGENQEGKEKKKKSGPRYGHSDDLVNDFIAAIHYM